MNTLSFNYNKSDLNLVSRSVFGRCLTLPIVDKQENCDLFNIKRSIVRVVG